MIVDHLSHAERYRFWPALFQALTFMRDTLESPREERTALDGDRLYVNRVTLVTKPLEECIFEAHRRFLDVHCILSGTEGISIRPVEELEPVQEFDLQKDIGFYQGEPSGTYYLKPGCFLVCWPNEAHRVAMMQNAPGQVEKYVAKIAADCE